MVARVDLKLDRRAGRLEVLGSYGEDGIAIEVVCRELAEELTEVARWLEADDVAVSPNGDLATPLARRL